jgi:type I restriction enzyme S subunit
MSGSTREKITKDEMNRIIIPVPPCDQQEDLVDYIAAELHKQNMLKKRWQRQLELLVERRQALITAAVTGQFDVSTASGRGVTE